jgi:hypothetical protein
MRLNGWQRIGIVASVIWAIGAPIYLDNAAEQKVLGVVQEQLRSMSGQSEQ